MKGRYCRIIGVLACMMFCTVFTLQVFAGRRDIRFGSQEESAVFGHAEELSYTDNSTDEGKLVFTLGKVPVDCSVDTLKYHVFINGLLDEMPESFENAQIDRETIDSFMSGPDNEVLMIPAEYIADNTPYYVMVYITDGFSNLDSRLSKLSATGLSYLLNVIRGYYVEEEQADFSAIELASEKFITCDRIVLYENEEDGYATDYYTLWNGDLVQVMARYYDKDMKDAACGAAEEFLSSWTDYQE